MSNLPDFQTGSDNLDASGGIEGANFTIADSVKTIVGSLFFVLVVDSLAKASGLFGDFSSDKPSPNQAVIAAIDSLALWSGIFFIAAALNGGTFDGLARRVQLKSVSPLKLIGAFALGGICQTIGVFVVYLPLRLVAPDVVEKVSQPARELTQSATEWKVILLALIVGFGAPFFEEFAFRGMLQSSLQDKMSLPRALSISSIAFACFHFQVIQFPALLLFGGVLGLLLTRFGSLWMSVACHSGFNLASLAILLATL